MKHIDETAMSAVGMLILVGATLVKSGGEGLMAMNVLIALSGLCYLLYLTLCQGDFSIVFDGDLKYCQNLVEEDQSSINVSCNIDEEGRISPSDISSKDNYVLFALVAIASAYHPIGVLTMIPALWFSLSKSSVRSTMGLSSAIEEIEQFDGVMKDGLYKVITHSFLNIERQVGMGVVIDNVFHTLYHVTKGYRVLYEGRYVLPSYGNKFSDTICYNGGWKIKDHISGSVQLHAREPGGPRTVHTIKPGKCVLVDTAAQNSKYIFALDLKAGSSGSPILDSSDKVVGLYGYGFLTSNVPGGYASLIASDNPGSEDDTNYDINPGVGKPCYREICSLHPGAGKTRKVILQLVLNSLEKKIHTVVLAPTRVVAEEIRNALPVD